jgi:hypothetical protein
MANLVPNFAIASWVTFYKYSKFDGGYTYVMLSNVSNESDSVSLRLYPNSQNQKVLTVAGFPFEPWITSMISQGNNNYDYVTNFRIRIGKEIHVLKTGMAISDKDGTNVILASDERNLFLVPKIEASIKNKEEIAVEFTKTGAVYTFKGNTIVKFVDGKQQQ